MARILALLLVLTGFATQALASPNSADERLC